MGSRKNLSKARRQRRVRGGEGPSTSDFGVKAFGPMDSQHAIPGTNVIAVNKMSGGNCNVVPVSTGGSGMTEIAVPAVLLIANNLYGRKTRGKKSRGYRSRKQRGSRRSKK